MAIWVLYAAGGARKLAAIRP